MAQVISHKDEHDARFAQAVRTALRVVGGQGERFAKETIRDMGAVDTGFLRNSITFALDGEEPNISEYADDAGEQHGEYGNSAPSEGQGKRSVIIGTNVYYAPYVEFGTYKMAARPFLTNAIQGNQGEIEDIFQQTFSALF